MKMKIFATLGIGVSIYLIYLVATSKTIDYGYPLKVQINVSSTQGKSLSNLSLKVFLESRRTDLKAEILSMIDKKVRTGMVEWVSIENFSSGRIFNDVFLTPDPATPHSVEFRFDKPGMKSKVVKVPWEKFPPLGDLQILNVVMDAS